MLGGKRRQVNESRECGVSQKGCWRKIAIDQQRKFRLGLSLESGGTPYVALRYADPLHPTRSRKNQGKPGSARRCQEGCRESGRKDSRLVLDHEKDRALRYQHASEMRADLQRLKRDTDTGLVS